MKRRDLLKLGAVLASSATLAGATATTSNGAGKPAPLGDMPMDGTPVPPPITVPPFGGPLHIPQTLRPARRSLFCDEYAMDIVPVTQEIVPGLKTQVWTFGGQFPGPVIRAAAGRPVSLRLTNNLTVPTATHLHGGHNAHTDDGFPTDIVSPGQSRTYHYPNEQRGAPLWYHDHALGHEAENVYRGLAGLYLLTDAYDQALPLPSGSYDVPLMLRDAHIAADGTLVFDMTNVNGSDRKIILVNGTPTPYFQVAARKYRFRIANTANERAFGLKLADGSPIVQIGSDGGLLPAPAEVDSVSVWPAERADVVIDFSRYPVGTQIVLQNTVTFPGERTEVMRFDVVREERDDSMIPDEFQPNPVLAAPSVQRSFSMSFDPATGQFLINGKTFDPNRVDVAVARGAVEAWTVTNTDTRIPIPHTFHVHLSQFQLVERNGKPPAAAESGLKDTVSLLPGESVTFHVPFEDFAGTYLYHCHMLEHAMDGMMGVFDVAEN